MCAGCAVLRVAPLRRALRSQAPLSRLRLCLRSFGGTKRRFCMVARLFAPPASKVAGFAPLRGAKLSPLTKSGLCPPRGARPSDRVSCAVSQQDAHSRPDLRNSRPTESRFASKLFQTPPRPSIFEGGTWFLLAEARAGKQKRTPSTCAPGVRLSVSLPPPTNTDQLTESG